MFKTLKNFFNKTPTVNNETMANAQLNLAMAALLVHAARLDGTFATQERDALNHILEVDFNLDIDARNELLELAGAAEEAATDLYRWTSIINQNMDEAEKTHIIEQLWSIILADDKIDDYEASLIRRVSGLIHIPDRVAGQARQRVEAKLKRN